MTIKDSSGLVLVNGKKLSDCTREEIEKELTDGADYWNSRVHMALNYIQNEEAHLKRENERLWKALGEQGRR